MSEHHCCDHKPAENHCHNESKKVDWLLWLGLLIVVAGYGLFLLQPDSGADFLNIFTASVFEMVNMMWWGVVIGFVFVGVLGFVPRELVMAVLGRGGTFSGILRATFAGVLMDLCSHGILMVGARLYERGASLGQLMTFLIASPWNSFSLTLILWAMIGLQWTLLFIAVSFLIALVSGLIFEYLVKAHVLPPNPNQIEFEEGFKFWLELKVAIGKIKWTVSLPFKVLWEGVKGGRMVVRWLFVGVILASVFRVFLTPDQLQTYFGATLVGLGLTILVATVIEVCSEGTVPIAADLFTRAQAPGNSFAFLMGGVSTDYTEVMVIKDTTGSWKVALFLPLVTLPQVILLAWLMNLA